jgi:AraC-like DNA-binding protein
MLYDPAVAVMDVTSELFARYADRRWRPELPLAVLDQHFATGAHTGVFRHEDFHALYVIQGGRGLHEIDGHAYPVKRGDVYMTAPGATVAYSRFRDLRAVVYCFQADFFFDNERDALSSLDGFQDLFMRRSAHKAPVAHRGYQMHLTPDQYRSIDALVRGIRDEMRRSVDVSPLLVRQQLFQLIVALARSRDSLSEHAAAKSVAGSMRLADIIRYCEAHFGEDLSVPRLASLMFLSPGHFAEVFTREMGQPPAAYLRQLRLEHAQSLLRETSLPMTDIALRCGIGDSAQLARAFRAAFNCTPSTYRRRFIT